MSVDWDMSVSCLYDRQKRVVGLQTVRIVKLVDCFMDRALYASLATMAVSCLLFVRETNMTFRSDGFSWAVLKSYLS